MGDGIKAAWLKLPRSAAEARRVGAPRFFSGEECRRGHVAPRLARNSYCAACKYEYKAAYRKTDVGRELRREECARRMAAIVAYAVEWRERNRDWYLERSRRYRDARWLAAHGYAAPSREQWLAR